jgi:hypothetical protein
MIPLKINPIIEAAIEIEKLVLKNKSVSMFIPVQ